MSAKILNGKEVSARIKDELKDKVTELKKDGIFPGLAVVLVGNDPASRVYVNSKKKACEFIGIESFEFTLPEDATEQQLLELVYKLNSDKQVNGILVQLPLPKHINEENIINAINPSKDVDAFHPANVGRIMTGNPIFLPCTPAGVGPKDC
jgi:methylenetetrahydrofolate dehydrogenase (NADP+)/methenyltetrahydrofolate cyclohydrolase